MTETKTKSLRGFASMDKERQKEIASKGGKAAHACGKAHIFSSEEARKAGRLGALAKLNRMIKEEETVNPQVDQ